MNALQTNLFQTMCAPIVSLLVKVVWKLKTNVHPASILFTSKVEQMFVLNARILVRIAQIQIYACHVKTHITMFQQTTVATRAIPYVRNVLLMELIVAKDAYQDTTWKEALV